MRFTKNKLCQQVMQEVAAVAVRQSVWERGGGFATGGFIARTKRCQILNWSATASACACAALVKNTPRSVLFSCVASNFESRKICSIASSNGSPRAANSRGKVYSRWRL